MDTIFGGDGLFGFSGDIAQSYIWGHVALTAVTATFFTASIAFSMMAFRAVGQAKQAKAEADAAKRSAQDFAVEVRHLTAQVERALTNAEAGGAATLKTNPVRVGARRDTEEAEVEILPSNDGAPKSKAS